MVSRLKRQSLIGQTDASRIIFFFIAATKTCPISSTTPKSRIIAFNARPSNAREVSGISLTTTLSRRCIVIANLAKGLAWAAVCATSSVLCSLHAYGEVVPRRLFAVRAHFPKPLSPSRTSIIFRSTDGH